MAGVSPSRNHPVSRGRLCARGWSAHEAPAWGQRLDSPRIRRGGVLETVSWEEALAEAAARLSALLAAGKPVGVIGSPRATNEENYLAVRLARGALSSGNLDLCSGTAYSAVADALQPAGTLDDVASSESLAILEGDLATSHPQAAAAVLTAVHSGARLITIGAARTQMARLAVAHLQATPGREEEVLARLVAAVPCERADDAPTEAGGNRRASRLEASGLAEGDVDRAARWLAKARRAAFLIPADGRLGEGAGGVASALAALAAATGHLGRPGSAVVPLAARANLRGARDVGVRPDAWPGGARLGDPMAADRLGGEWGRPPSAREGSRAAQLPAAVAGLVVVAEDLTATLLDGAAAAAALGALEFLLVLDAFATPTAALAHVSLPIASLAETEGTVTPLDGRHQAVRACVAPPGRARAGWRVLADLGGALGLPTGFDTVAGVTAEIARAVPPGEPAPGEGLAQPLAEATAEAAHERRKRSTPSPPPADGAARFPFRLALADGFDWGRDVLVAFSPTLCRDHLALRKMYPRGAVEMSREDAESLGVRQGWTVRVCSTGGEAALGVMVRPDLMQGVLRIPFAFREPAAPLLAGATSADVRVERA